METPSSSLILDRETKASERPGDHKDELRLWLRMLTCSTLIESEIRTQLREEFKTTLPRFDLMAQLEKSTTGMTVGEVLQAHPHLEETDIRAALGFAADYLRREEIIFGEPATAA